MSLYFKLIYNKAAEVSATYVYQCLGDNMSISALRAFLEFFFLRTINMCDNTDTENIKLIVLTFILCN